MGRPFFSVEYSGADLDTNLSGNIISLSTREGLKTRVGTAEFQIQNIDDDFTEDINIDDVLDVYMGYAGSAHLFSGFVNELSDVSDMKQRNYKITAVNKMERLLSQLDSKDYPVGGANNTAGEILVDIITRINGFKKPDEPAITTTNVSTTALDITPYAYNYRPVMEILRELASEEKTGNGQYLYYIDKDNDLHFKPRPSPGVTTPSIHEYNFTNFRATYGVFDLINAVIVNCGKDDNGAAVLALGVNYNSVTSVGFRWKYILKNEIADSYKNKGLAIGDQRNAMRADGESWAISYTKMLGEPRWKIDAIMRGNYNYPGTSTQMILGEVVRSTSPTNWNGSKVLRVMDIQHSFTISEWKTTLQFEEDDKTKVQV